LSVAALDMIAMRGQITAKVRQGLVPALGASTGGGEAGTRPKNEEAYDLYLRSVSIPHDPAPNKEAIAMLERSVGIDSSYAPAWTALGNRYYYDASYSNGGEEIFQRSNIALERALALDPNLALAAASLIVNQTERGQLAKAHRDAEVLVKRQPESARAHFALAYVSRYAGLLEESARECDTALALDPGNYELRSCAFTFAQLGKEERAMEFLRLDAGSEWFNDRVPLILVGGGKTSEALESTKRMSAGSKTWAGHSLDELCLASPLEFEKIAGQAEATFMKIPDPEARYTLGAFMFYCGAKDSGLRLIKGAREQNYCAYQTLQSDPLLAELRGTPEFNQMLSAAKECQDRFLAQQN
jgi:hypothetical protein